MNEEINKAVEFNEKNLDIKINEIITYQKKNNIKIKHSKPKLAIVPIKLNPQPDLK